MGELKSAIRLNITSLFDDADILATREHYGSAIHLMMAAREESVKWILVHCWVYLNQDTRNKIFNHKYKHKTADIFYFMSGELHAIDLVVGALALLKDKEPQVGESIAALIDLLPKRIFYPKTIAISITSLLHSGLPNEAIEIKEKQKIALANRIAEAEKLRQNSIYVDFDQALNIGARPQSFNKDDYEKIRKDVILAIYHIDKLSGLNPNNEVLHSTFPEWKDELETNLKELASRLADEKRDG